MLLKLEASLQLETVERLYSHHGDLFTTATLVIFLPEGNSPLTVKVPNEQVDA